jgi:hypothetical protein
MTRKVRKSSRMGAFCRELKQAIRARSQAARFIGKYLIGSADLRVLLPGLGCSPNSSLWLVLRRNTHPDASKKNGSAPLLDARCDIAAMFLSKQWTQPMDRAARD